MLSRGNLIREDTRLSSCSARGWLRESSSIDSSESCSESVWSRRMKCNCLEDLSSEWELCLESGDLYLDAHRELNLLVDGVGFVDLLFLCNFSEKSSRVWSRSVFWRLEPWNSLRMSLMVDFMIEICLGVKSRITVGIKRVILGMNG